MLTLELLSYWHPGTGRGDGVGADAVVHRDPSGLPVVPGRTVKGLLRNAAKLAAEAGMGGPGLVEVFGSSLPAVNTETRVHALEARRFETEAGALRVGSAELGNTDPARAAWRSLATSEAGRTLVPTLRTTLSSTALEDGVAKDNSLRTMEVWVPVTLYARLGWEASTPPPWKTLNDAVGLFLRSLGSGRNRGLGRCAARIDVVST